MDKTTKKYVGIFVVLLIVVIVLAIYGWLMGSWESTPQPDKEGMWHGYQNSLFSS